MADKEITTARLAPPNQNVRVGRLKVSALQDIGKGRADQEDSYYVPAEVPPDDPGPHLLLIADGMGGVAAGEVASRLAVEVIGREFYRHDSAAPKALLVRAIEEANRAIWSEAQAERERSGMGTTVVGVAFNDGRFVVAHVGDSRAYLIRDGAISRLTIDHSWVEEQARGGNLTEEEARLSPYRHLITRVLGQNPEVTVDTSSEMELRPGDILVLCTDGLTNVLSDRDIFGIVSSKPPKEAARELIATALARQDEESSDNVTALVAAWPTGNEPTAKPGQGLRPVARLRGLGRLPRFPERPRVRRVLVGIVVLLMALLLARGLQSTAGRLLDDMQRNLEHAVREFLVVDTDDMGRR